MKTRLIASVAAVLLLVTLQSGMASTLGTNHLHGCSIHCTEIGITIHFDSHQTSWNGVFSCHEKSGWTVEFWEGSGGASVLKPGNAHPLAIAFTKKGVALLRTAFQTSMVLMKLWLKERVWFLEIR